MDTLAKLQSRELGEFPVSFGTSMAVLLTVDANTESPSLKEAKEKPEQLWINLGTLIRNINNAVDGDIPNNVTQEMIVKVLREEVILITQYLRDAYGDKLRVVFYQSEYKWLSRKFPRANIKEPTTDKQKAYDRVLKMGLKGIDELMDELIAEEFTLGEKPYVDYHKFNDFPESKFNTLWVLTHHPVDLLGFKRAKKVMLLESHTARLRAKHEWNQKLTGSKLDSIPFNKLTIQVFGDRGTNFGSLGNKYKKIIFEVAAENRWNPTTSPVMVDFHISKMKDTFSATILRGMLK